MEAPKHLLRLVVQVEDNPRNRAILESSTYSDIQRLTFEGRHAILKLERIEVLEAHVSIPNPCPSVKSVS